MSEELKISDSMKLLYDYAKKAKLGSPTHCPGCGRNIVKNVYNKIFCTNQRSEKRRNVSCKDFYWNTIIPSRKFIFGNRR